MLQKASFSVLSVTGAATSVFSSPMIINSSGSDVYSKTDKTRPASQERYSWLIALEIMQPLRGGYRGGYGSSVRSYKSV